MAIVTPEGYRQRPGVIPRKKKKKEVAPPVREAAPEKERSRFWGASTHPLEEPMTLEERLRDICLSYSEAIGKPGMFPSPEKTFQFLVNPILSSIQTREQMFDMFSPMKNIETDDAHPLSDGDDFYFDTENQLEVAKKGTKRVAVQTGKTQLEYRKVKSSDWDIKSDFTQPWYLGQWKIPDPGAIANILNTFAPAHSLITGEKIQGGLSDIALSNLNVITNRLANATGNESLRNKEYWDIELDNAFRANVLNSIMPYLLFPDKISEEEFKQAEEVLSLVSRGNWDGKVRGFINTVTSLKLKEGDEDVFELAWNGFAENADLWNMTKDQARWAYAERFGEERLPKKEADILATQKTNIAGLIGEATGHPWEKIKEHVPYLSGVSNWLGEVYTGWDEIKNQALVTIYEMMADTKSPLSGENWQRTWNDADHKRIVDEVCDDIGIENKIVRGVADMATMIATDGFVGRTSKLFAKPTLDFTAKALTPMKSIENGEIASIPALQYINEALVDVNSPYLVKRFLGLSDSQSAKKLAVEIAGSRDPKYIQESLYRLQLHGEIIPDMGAPLLTKSIRLSWLKNGQVGELPELWRAEALKLIPDRMSKFTNSEDDIFTLAQSSGLSSERARYYGDRMFSASSAEETPVVRAHLDDIGEISSRDGIPMKIYADDYGKTYARSPEGDKLKTKKDAREYRIRTFYKGDMSPENIKAANDWAGSIIVRKRRALTTWNTTRSPKQYQIWNEFWSEVEASARATPAPKNLNAVLPQNRAGITNMWEYWEAYQKQYNGYRYGKREPRVRRRAFSKNDAVVPVYLKPQLKKSLDEAEGELMKAVSDNASPQEVERIKKELAEARRNWELINSDPQYFAQHKPVWMYQMAKMYVHPHDPRLFSLFMAGPGVRKLEMANVVKMGVNLDQITSEYKRFVMATISFPTKVFVSDELARLIPEGVLSPLHPIRTGRTLKARVELARGKKLNVPDGEGIPLARFPDELTADDLTGFVRGNTDDYGLVFAEDQRHFQALNYTLFKFREEPIVQAWIKSDKPNEDTIRKLIKSDTPEGAELRQALIDTGRMRDGDFSSPQFDEFVNECADTLRGLDSDAKTYSALREGRPLTPQEYAHLSENAKIPVPFRFDNKRLPIEHHPAVQKAIGAAGSAYNVPFKMLGGFQHQMQKLLYSYKYSEVWHKEKKISPHIDEVELHRSANNQALRYVERVCYSHSPTILEEAMRNVVLFLPAYRQFATYWTQAFLRNPLPYIGAKELMGNTEFAINGEDIPLVGKYLKDWQFYRMYVPFWTEPGNFIENNMPGLGPAPTWLVRGMKFVLPEDVKATMSKVTGIESADELPGLLYASDRISVLGRVDDLLWGMWSTNNRFLSKPKDARQRFSNNIAQALIARGYDPDIEGQIQKMKESGEPFYYSVLSQMGCDNPDGVINFFAKQFAPVPVGWVPEETQEYYNGYYKYKSASTNNERRNILKEYPIFGKTQEYFNADAQGKEKWRTDPENAKLVGYVTGQFPTGDIYATTIDKIEATKEGKRQRYTTTKFVEAIQANWDNFIKDKSENAGIPEKEQYLKDAELWARNYITTHPNQFPLGANPEARTKQYLEDFMEPMKIITEDGQEKYVIGGMWYFVPEASKWNIRKADEELSALKAGVSNGLSKTEIKKMITLSNMMGYVEGGSLISRSKNYQQVRDYLSEQKQIATKMLIDFATTPGYRLNAAMLVYLGGNPTMKTQMALNKCETLYQDWDAFKDGKLKTFLGLTNTDGKVESGSDLYRASRNKYYALKEKILSKVPCGEMLVGGLPERLTFANNLTRAISYGDFSQFTPDVAATWDSNGVKYEKIWAEIMKECRKETIDEDRLLRLSKASSGLNKSFEQFRNGIFWATLIATSKSWRYKLMGSYSEYYEGKGNSVSSKMGKLYVKELNKYIKTLAKSNPSWGEEVERYFGRLDVASKLLDWYR